MKNTIPWLFLILGITISTFLWGYISFSYDTSNSIIGQYSSRKINPSMIQSEDYFLFFSLLLYFFAFIKFNKKSIEENIFQSRINSSNSNIDYLCIILNFLIFRIL